MSLSLRRICPKRFQRAFRICIERGFSWHILYSDLFVIFTGNLMFRAFFSGLPWKAFIFSSSVRVSAHVLQLYVVWISQGTWVLFWWWFWVYSLSPTRRKACWGLRWIVVFSFLHPPDHQWVSPLSLHFSSLLRFFWKSCEFFFVFVHF